jgi:hypothetical protein
MNPWMIISLLALALVASFGYSTKKVTDNTTGKEVCREQVKETTLKRTSLQLWENIVRL